MKIVFNALRSGLGNNGGTKTLLRSAEVLASLGHTVDVVCGVNRYSWHSPGVAISAFLPTDADVIIAASDLDIHPSQPNTHYWIRGWSVWNRPENQLVEKLRTVKCIANSTWLANKVQSYGIECGMCFAGLDLDRWYGIRSPLLDTGGIIYNRPNQPTKRDSWTRQVASSICEVREYNDTQMRSIYGQYKTWVSCSINEGFHNVAAEAALCGCEIVCPSIDTCGMHDWANQDTAYLCTSIDEYKDAVCSATGSKVPRAQKMIRDVVGSRERNMQLLVEIL